MEITLATPSPDSLEAITATLASWQGDSTPNHIHPGDLGWFQRSGAEKTAASIRTWYSADGTILAIGLLDGDDLLRATTAPSARGDETLARAMAADIADPAKGILPAGNVSFDISADALVREHVAAVEGWADADEWTWLSMDLTVGASKGLHNMRVEIVTTSEQVQQSINVHGLAFSGSTFTEEKWHAMAASPASKVTGARSLLLYEGDEPVGAATVWSAGAGKPGILEPVGVSEKYQRRGLGTALCRAAAAELKNMGASSAVVATPSSNAAAVATYKKAGFVVARLHRDLCREK
ncbi:hypothetical protein K4F52_003933 [Lecanicillium sp. MT-2017a]|nr:hypothetical protein K4F52_003933 [Lecanicillium sp. MT-2017a]